jgi:acetyl-CoA carboxylase biotin carboxyl carrier protein
VSLTAADVAEIMRLLESSTFDELDLEINGVKLSLRRGGASADMPSARPPAMPTPPQPALAPQAPASHAPAKPAAVAPGVHPVAAPLLGTFYRAPRPGAPPFVEVGSTVEPDTVVGIIEVMKLMNTVHAGIRGTVVEILAGDGALVEFGETILHVAKSG